MLKHGYVKIYRCISLSCCIDLSKLLGGFVNLVSCMHCPLPNKTKIKFDRDF